MPAEIVCALAPASRGRELEIRLKPSNVTLAANATELDTALGARKPEMVIASTRVLTPPIETWIRRVRDLPENPDVVLVHDTADAEFRAGAIRHGCLAVLDSTLLIDELAATIQALIERRIAPIRVVHATSPPRESRLRDFVSLSPKMREFLAVARRVVHSDTSLLLLGETGSGKERLARALHQEGPRAAAPFVAVNCGAMPESLFESEFFGHEKSAFTGASGMHKGYFEQAAGGTLFLDEIGEVPLHLQVKLLRVLEDRQVQRLGAERSFPVDIRIIAATNRNPEHQVEAGQLREDLFYRLGVVTLEIPPLRERMEDIPGLFESYVAHFCTTLNRPVHGVRETVIEALTRYSWPGNLRELINVAERAVLLAPGPEIGLSDLPESISGSPRAAAGSRPLALPSGAENETWLGQPLGEARRQVLDDFERRYVSAVLRDAGGRVGVAASRAGINERSLFDLMRRHRLRKEDYRPRRPSSE